MAEQRRFSSLRLSRLLIVTGRDAGCQYGQRSRSSARWSTAYQRGILFYRTVRIMPVTPRWRICRSISSARSIYPGAERVPRDVNKLATRRRTKAGTALTDYINFTTAPPKNGGESGFVPILATTTYPGFDDLTPVAGLPAGYKTEFHHAFRSTRVLCQQTRILKQVH